MRTRRDFIRLTLAGGAAFLIGAGEGRTGDAAGRAPWKPNAWIRIDGDGVVVIVGKQEMGQGVRTSLAMIVAEELDLDWAKIRIEQASTGPGYTSLNTGGSGSIYRSWRTLRPAAAAAREMLLRAAAKEWKVARPSLRTENGAVVHQASGRTRSYASLAAVAATLEIPKDVPLKSPADFRIVGRRAKRLDGPAIVTGAAKYGLDARVPGMRFATLVRCPVAGGTLRSFDAADAKKVRGVREVIEVPNAVAVVADSSWAALKAQALVRAEWNDGPGGAFDSDRYIDTLLSASNEDHVTRRDGDVPAAMAAAAKTLEAKYVYPFYAHAPVEPMNAVARVRDGRCEIWAPTQAPNRVQELAAKRLGMAAEQVTVHPTLIGGGFGRRLAADYALEAVDVSKALGGAPVQVLWSRTDDMQFGHLQHATVEALRAAIDAQGNLVAWSHAKVSNPIMSIFPPPGTDDPETYLASGAVDIPYAIPNVAVSYVHVPSPVRYGPWRSVESPASVFGRECFLDEIAHAAGRDPLQMRLDLLQGTANVKVGGRAIDRARLRRVLETVRDRSDWGKRRGQGVACNIYDGDTYVAHVAEVTVTGDGWRVDRVVSAVDCGPVINPTGVEQQTEGGVVWALTQLMTEITIRAGRVEQRSYADFAVPRLRDTPRIEVHIVPTEGPQPCGMGEPPVPPLAPAVLNAMFSATGKRIRRLPVGR
jgi:isoquinoline 1-oxidoreductase beta subunit